MRVYQNADFEYYMSLIIILGLSVLFVVLASPNKDLQLTIILLTTFFYVFFGIIHHLINHDLSLKIVLEYLIIGTFGVSVLLFFLKGGLFL